MEAHTRLGGYVGFLSVLACGLAGCADDEPMTEQEARDALAEVTSSSQASALTAAMVDLPHAFSWVTDGASSPDAEAAASEISDALSAQAPCAEVTRSKSTVTIRFGKTPGSCSYKGLILTGTQTTTVRTRASGVTILDYTWTNLSNGVFDVTGKAHIVWSPSTQTRDVTDDLTWTRLSDGASKHVTGHGKQTPLGGDFSDGVTLDASEAWQTPQGPWAIAVTGAQVRWADLFPQAGTIVLSSPGNHTTSIDFRRIDATTIRVSMATTGRTLEFDVRR